MGKRIYKYRINSKGGNVPEPTAPSSVPMLREHKGAWDAKATYSQGDTVIYNGIYYTATTGKGKPGGGDGWQISGIVDAKSVSVEVVATPDEHSKGDQSGSIVAAKAKMGDKDITAGLPANGWRWTWRGKEVASGAGASLAIAGADIPADEGRYEVTAAHAMAGSRGVAVIRRVYATAEALAREQEETRRIAREAITWEVEPVSLRPDTPLYLDAKSADKRLHQLQMTVRYLRAGRDVSPVMARSAERLYTWERHSPLGRDDKGVTDEQWTADNATRDIITLTPDDVMWIACITTRYDADRLEEEYQRLTH